MLPQKKASDKNWQTGKKGTRNIVKNLQKEVWQKKKIDKKSRQKSYVSEKSRQKF